VRTRTITEHRTAAIVLAIILGLATPPARAGTLPFAGGGGRVHAGVGNGLGSLWDEMISLLSVRWGLAPGGTARGGAGAAKASAASTGDSSQSAGPSGTSNSTINPDGTVSLNP
jgi:hypothetical protein